MQLPQLTDVQIFDDLSKVMKSIKEIIKLFEKAIKLSKGLMNSTYQTILQQIQTIVKDLCFLVSKYKRTILQNKKMQIMYKLVFQQDLSVDENKFRKPLVFGQISQFLQQLSKAVFDFTEQQQFYKFLIKITNFIIKYSEKILSIDQSGESNHFKLTNFAMFGLQIQKKIQPKFQPFSFIKMLQNINQRYTTLIGMDLDYSLFRSEFFLSKNKNNSMFENYLEKNKNIKQQINLYQINYNKYKNKRKKKKNKQRIHSQQIHTIQDASQQFFKSPKKLSISIKSLINKQKFQKLNKRYEQISSKQQTKQIYNGNDNSNCQELINKRQIKINPIQISGLGLSMSSKPIYRKKDYSRSPIFITRAFSIIHKRLSNSFLHKNKKLNQQILK